MQKVAQLPSQKQSLGAQRGKALHGIVEQYLLNDPAGSEETILEFAERTGMFDHDLRHGLRSASEGTLLSDLRRKNHDAQSGIELLIEQEFGMSPVFMGYIDLIVLDRTSGALQATVRDHKFTADKRYIPSEESAKSDYQTLIYARAVMDFFRLDSVNFSYDYYGTKYKWQSFIQFNLTREFVEGKWVDIVKDTRSVLNNYKVPTGTETTPNYMSCQNYGGCEFKELCFGEKTK